MRIVGDGRFEKIELKTCCCFQDDIDKFIDLIKGKNISKDKSETQGIKEDWEKLSEYPIKFQSEICHLCKSQLNS